MIPAELTDRINNLVHLPQFHAIHQLVKFIEIVFDLGIVKAVALRQLLSRGKITFYSLIFMEWAMNCKVCVLWVLW